MPTYICEKCGCIDNTACGGNYWLVQWMKHENYSNPFFKDDYANKHVLCTECTPSEFYDGSKILMVANGIINFLRNIGQNMELRKS